MHFDSTKYALILVLLIYSCGNTNVSIDNGLDNDTIIVSEALSTPSPIPIAISDLQNKVFEIGSTTHFTDTCSFYFECDCCAGDLIFSNDSTFYYIAYCMDDATVLEGNYSLGNSIVTLYYNGHCVSREYNYKNEIDTSAVDYLMRDTIIKPFTQEYIPTRCGDKIKLVETTGGECAIETTSDFNRSIKFLKEEGLLERFEK